MDPTAAASEGNVTATGSANTASLNNSTADTMNNMTSMYIFAQQAQQELSMISTLGGLAQDAAKDKPQV